MILVSVFVVFTISLCSANTFVCHYYAENSKSLQIYCDHYQIPLPKNCSHDDLSISPSDVLNLKFEGCDQSTIANASVIYPNTVSLDISFSGFNELNWTSNVFENVVLLNASFNELSVIPTSILSKFPKIKQLFLTNNKIERISNGDFENVGQELKDIVLTHNRLKSIDDNAFTNLKSLSRIEISYNKFSTLPAALSNSSVQDIIMLENRKLTTINCTFIEALGSKHVYFTWKYITSFDGSCNSKWKFFINETGWNAMDGIFPSYAGGSKMFCNSSDFGNCFGNIIDFVAGPDKFANVTDMFKVLGPSVVKIDVSGNPVKIFGKIKLRNGTVDDVVKLLGPSKVDPLNNPRNISVVTELSVSAVDFERFPNLRELNLADTGLELFSFYFIKRNPLTHLDLSKNNLQSLESTSELRNLIQLTHFDVSGNQLKNIDEVIKYLPPSIQHLNISGNPLNKLPVFYHYNRFRALAHLNLSDTQLAFFKTDSFESLRHLISLDISHNDLKDVDFSTLKSLNRLKEFRAASDQITNITEIIGNLAASVEKLDLNGNSNAKFDLSSFDRLQNLKELNLSNINNDTELEEIDIDRLSSTLEVLDLHGNHLEQIIGLDRKHFSALKILDISNNQLDCDHLNDLRAEFKDINVISDKCDKYWIILITILSILGILFLIILCNLCILPKISKLSK